MKELIKTTKKALTKASNKATNSLNSKTNQFFNDIQEVYFENHYYDNDKHKVIYTKKYLNEILNYRFGYKKILDWDKAIKLLREHNESAFADRLQKLYDVKLPLALEAKKLEDEVKILEDKFIGGNHAERLIKKALNSEKNEQNRQKLMKFINSLKDWKEPSLTLENEILINGHKVKEDTNVGVIIGSGNKIHQMSVFVGTDKETNEKFIALRNYTQWRYSDLCIVDIYENIPCEVVAYFDKN